MSSGAVALAFAVAALVAGDLLTQPAPEHLGAPPRDLNARVVAFASTSGATLKGWFAPGATGQGAVLLLHSVRSNKRSMVARAKFLRQLDYGVFLVDLQAHGESSGDRITFGYRESRDAKAAVLHLKALAPRERLAAIGVSLGAVSLVLSDAHPLLSALVLESMYPAIEDAVKNRLRIRFGPLGPLLAPVLLRQLEPRLGVSPQALQPIARLKPVTEPVLLIQGTEDRHTTLEEAEHVFAALPGVKEMYAVPGAGHVDLHHYDTAEYERRIASFFAKHLRWPIGTSLSIAGWPDP
ncbi:MAG TPA: prolyl oligopeptidase family serine peptidase [Burkholderiales bacterium]|nr:prolyl oligopeptidase family serine peptidase [Burkholderiales bacterium]